MRNRRKQQAGWMCLSFLLCSATPLMAGPTETMDWIRVETPDAKAAWVAVTAHSAKTSVLFAATPRDVYRSLDHGKTWQHSLRLPGQTQVTSGGLAASPSEPTSLLLATNRGLYGSQDEGATWSLLTQGIGNPEMTCTSVRFHPMNSSLAALGTQEGLFVSFDAGGEWQKLKIPSEARHVVQVVWAPQQTDRLYLLSTEGVFVGSTQSGEWQKWLGAVEQTEEPPEELPDEALEAIEEDGLRFLPFFRSMAVDWAEPPRLYVATARGLRFSDDDGKSWRWLPRTGLGDASIHRLLLLDSPPLLYAATTSGPARYDAEAKRWHFITHGMMDVHVNDLFAASGKLWAAADQGLYRSEQSAPHPKTARSSASQPPEWLSAFAHEPTIAQVREAAIRYAEVQPQKISSWRKQARLRAILPDLSLSTDTNLTDFRHWDSGTNPDSLLRGERDLNWDASVSWDLGDLIWSTDQTSIDSRSKLMVELRDDIVDEVTRVYFERRRLQTTLFLTPPKDERTNVEQQLRLQELTALLDGLTGGAFSVQLSNQRSGL